MVLFAIILHVHFDFHLCIGIHSTNIDISVMIVLFIDSNYDNVCVTIALNGFYMMTSSNGNIFRVTGPLCGEFTGPGEFPTQRPVTCSFDVFFDLRLNKRLSIQWWGWWFETLSRPLWCHRNVCRAFYHPFTHHHKCIQMINNGRAYHPLVHS